MAAAPRQALRQRAGPVVEGHDGVEDPDAGGGGNPGMIVEDARHGAGAYAGARGHIGDGRHHSPPPTFLVGAYGSAPTPSCGGTISPDSYSVNGTAPTTFGSRVPCPGPGGPLPGGRCQAVGSVRPGSAWVPWSMTCASAQRWRASTRVASAVVYVIRPPASASA